MVGWREKLPSALFSFPLKKRLLLLPQSEMNAIFYG